MMRWMTVAICGAALLAACSKTEFIYTNADWFVYRWVDKLIGAEGAQPQRWRTLFARVLEDHRTELLPRTVALLGDYAVQAERGMTHDGLRCLSRSVQGLLEAHAALAVAPGTQVLGDVSGTQVDRLAAMLDERLTDYREDYLQPDPAERQRARAERFAERIAYWTGELTNEQYGMIKRAIQRMPDISADWLAYREQQQRLLVRLLRASPEPRELSAFLHAWWVERADRDPLLTQRFARMRDAMIDLLVSLDATLDATQRAEFVGNIVSLRDDLAGVAGVVDGISVAAHGAPHCAQSL